MALKNPPNGGFLFLSTRFSSNLAGQIFRISEIFYVTSFDFIYWHHDEHIDYTELMVDYGPSRNWRRCACSL